MLKPAKPKNEEQRVEALRALNILDTPEEERFDRLTRKLATVLDVPIAYLALIDADRQWLKSRVGDLECEVERDNAFCSHTILRNQPLIVRDAREDPRFIGNPLVEGEPHIRFYAGMPLTSSDGHNIGTLCIADKEPRDLDESDLDVIKAFAASVEKQINLKPRVFVSYSHRDEDWKNRLLEHLAVLQEQDLLNLWDDGQIDTGQTWHREITEAIEGSNVAILLVSANLLTSKFVLDVEIPRLLRRRDREGLHILPLLVKPCAWSRVDWLAEMNVYPHGAKPLSAESEHAVDEDLAKFATLVLEKASQAPRTTPGRSARVVVETPPLPHAQARQDGVDSDEPPLLGHSVLKLLLTMVDRPDAPPEAFVFRQQRVSLGRHAECDVPVLEKQRLVSSRHAEIVATDDRFLLTDLGSKNFTFLNGERLDPKQAYEVHSGDEINLAECATLQVKIVSVEGSPTNEDGTSFAPSYINPFTDDAMLLADVLRRVGDLYEGEAASRRRDALTEALQQALGEDVTQEALEVIGRVLTPPAKRSGDTGERKGGNRERAGRVSS